jgi:hypothetical protein
MANQYTQEIHDYVEALDKTAANARRIMLEKQILDLRFELDLVKSRLEKLSSEEELWRIKSKL